MKLVFQMVILLFWHSLSAMISDEQQIVTAEKIKEQWLKCRGVARLVNSKDMRNLQTTLGAELAKVTGLGHIFSYIPTQPREIFHAGRFQTLEDCLVTFRTTFFEMPVINHAGTRIAIPMHYHRVHIVDLRKSDVVVAAQCRGKNNFCDLLNPCKIAQVAWSFDDRYIATLAPNETIHVHDALTGKRIDDVQVFGGIFCWRTQYPSHLIARNWETHTIDIIDVVSKTRQCIKIPGGEFWSGIYKKTSMECSPDGTYLMYNSGREITVINLHDETFCILGTEADFGGLRFSHVRDYNRIDMIAWSHNSRYLVYTSFRKDEHALIIWDVFNNTQVVAGPTQYFCYGTLVSVAWSKDSSQLIIVVDRQDQRETCHNYVRVIFDPWQSTVKDHDQTDQTDEWQSSVRSNLVEVPMGPINGDTVRMSHDGRFLLGIEKYRIIFYDYFAEQHMREYLQSQIPLKQALVLLAIFKSALKNKSLLLDSPAIQQAFNDLPDYLRVGLKKWVEKPRLQWQDTLCNLFANFSLKK